jgi:hypothetical protein
MTMKPRGGPYDGGSFSIPHESSNQLAKSEGHRRTAHLEVAITVHFGLRYLLGCVGARLPQRHS